jgi:hypothetical protein
VRRPRLFGVAYAQADVSEVRVRGGQLPAESGERQVFAALLRRSGAMDSSNVNSNNSGGGGARP